MQVCNGVEHALFKRIALRRRPDELILLDGSQSPPQRIPPALGVGRSRSRRELGSAPRNRRKPSSLCERRLSTTLLETGKVRVYALPEGSAKLPTDQSILGQPVFGCLKATGKSSLLNLPIEKRAFWLAVDPHALAVSAPLVAYVFTAYYRDTHQTWVRVKNLRTGELVRSCLAGAGQAPNRRPRVVKIVMNSRGAVAWGAKGDPEGSVEHVVVACDSVEPRSLDEGEGIDPESLSLRHSVLHWLDEGEPLSERLR